MLAKIDKGNLNQDHSPRGGTVGPFTKRWDGCDRQLEEKKKKNLLQTTA